MEKMIMFLILTLGWLGLNAQTPKGFPIRKYQEKNYTASDFRELCLGSSDLSINYRVKMLEIVNRRLREEGKDLVLTEKNIDYITKRIKFCSATLPFGYINSLRPIDSPEEVHMYSEQDTFTGEVAVFEIEELNFSVILFKAKCLNLLDSDVICVVKQSDPTPEPKKDAPTPDRSSDEIDYTKSIIVKTTEDNSTPINPTIVSTKKQKRVHKTWVSKHLIPFLIGSAVSSVALTLEGIHLFKSHKNSGGPGGSPLTPPGDTGGGTTGGPGGSPLTP